MVLLCFALDLRTLSPPLIRDLKQSLLQLANLYSISAPRSSVKPLRDRIGLCYVLKNRMSCVDELKVAYSPRGNFNLRDFHHAVNNLPSDSFAPDFNSSGVLSCDDIKLSSVLSNKVLYSWGSHDNDIARKVILISSCLVKDLDSLKNTLMDAADKCVSVDFVLFEQTPSHLNDPRGINNFLKHICDLDNCSFQTYLPDVPVLCSLVKRWLQELNDETEEPHARFIFKNNLMGSLSQICATLSTSFNHIIDEFIPCQTCRCHGFSLKEKHGNKIKRPCSCPITGSDLGTLDIIENSVKVGVQTILFMPSFHQSVKLHKASSSIDFKVIERTNLGSLSEGLMISREVKLPLYCLNVGTSDAHASYSQTQYLETYKMHSLQTLLLAVVKVGAIFGTSYFVTPSTSSDSDDIDKSELNNQLFQGLCHTLQSLDEGLICSSNCNLETLRETSFQCFYILLPSDKGLMLLRRLAGLEEIMPLPDISQLIESTAATDAIKNFVQASLIQMEVRDYNPVLHERGFHQKLNLLVKESLQFGSLPPKSKELNPEPNSTHQDSVEEVVPSKQVMDFVLVEDEIPLSGFKPGHDKITARIAEEWEQLVVNELPKISSPTALPKPKLDPLVFSSPESNKQLDEKTSRILERLEVPRQLKAKVVSPVISSSAPIDACMMKKPLIPFVSTRVSDQGTIGSQPMKPNFLRIKRKLR